MQRGVLIFCVDSLRTKTLLDHNQNSPEFAVYLVQNVLGTDRALFPTALAFSLHLTCQHFITLFLHVLRRKLAVYDSLTTGQSTKRSCKLLAVAFGLQESDVEYHDMVQQTENPPNHCAVFNLCGMNGLRHGIPPQTVGQGALFASTPTAATWRERCATSIENDQLDPAFNLEAHMESAAQVARTEEDTTAVNEFFSPFLVLLLFSRSYRTTSRPLDTFLICRHAHLKRLHALYWKLTKLGSVHMVM